MPFTPSRNPQPQSELTNPLNPQSLRRLETKEFGIDVVVVEPGGIRTPRGQINEIAYNLRSEYPQYFSKMFKKNTDMTPAEYRNLN